MTGSLSYILHSGLPEASALCTQRAFGIGTSKAQMFSSTNIMLKTYALFYLQKDRILLLFDQFRIVSYLVLQDLLAIAAAREFGAYPYDIMSDLQCPESSTPSHLASTPRTPNSPIKDICKAQEEFPNSVAITLTRSIRCSNQSAICRNRMINALPLPVSIWPNRQTRPASVVLLK